METHPLGLMSLHETSSWPWQFAHVWENKFKISLLLIQTRWSLDQSCTSRKEESNKNIISIIWVVQGGVWPYFPILTSYLWFRSQEIYDVHGNLHHREIYHHRNSHHRKVCHVTEIRITESHIITKTHITKIEYTIGTSHHRDRICHKNFTLTCAFETHSQASDKYHQLCPLSRVTRVIKNFNVNSPF